MTMQSQPARRPVGLTHEARGAERAYRADTGSTDGLARLARGIGWFSVGLGVAQLVAPRAMSRAVGLRGDRASRKAMRGIGVRELAAGIGILTRAQPAGWLWARVGGDLTDLGLMGAAMGAPRVKRRRATGATLALVGITLADVAVGRGLARDRGGRRRRAAPVEESITIRCPREQVYRFTRDVENAPRFMAAIERVERIDDRRSRWTARLPGGSTVSWEAQTIDDQPNERLVWRSVRGAPVDAMGSMRFVTAPGDRGTEVHARMDVAAPGGALAQALTKLAGRALEPKVRADLHRLKQLMEIGEVVQSDASLHRGPHPAQPPEEAFGRPAAVEGSLGTREDVVRAEGGVR